MLNCDEQVQIQKYKTHAYKTPNTARVQTIIPKHPTKQKRWVLKKKCTVTALHGEDNDNDKGDDYS